MKKFLQSMIERKQAEVTELVKRSNESESIEEVRSLGAQIDKVNAEIREAEAQLKETEARDFKPLSTYGATSKVEDTDMAYRSAFMNYVLRNTAIPTELRDVTKTTNVGAVIPNVLVEKIIEKMDRCGMILSRVTRTSFKAGVTIPTSSVKPVATWVAEGQGSTKQSKTVGSISFTYHKLRCEIAMTMEVGEMALSVFEAKFVENVAKAMVIAIEKAILKGDGTTQPQGIIGQEIPANRKTISTKVKYSELVEIESTVPVEFEETAVWVMTKAQFGCFLAMVDEQGQPIARVNYGISGKPERSLLGREVILHPYGDVTNGDMLIVDLNDYVLNTIYDMGISKKQDWDTEDLLTKAVMSVDGKLVDNTSVQLITFTV